jgi:bacteriocin biosynthesis cyclodehydratase domain-containing protein
LHLHLALLVSAAATSGTVPERPALAPWCRLVQDGDRFLAEHGGTLVTFEGRAVAALLPRLLPLLDGTRTVAELEDVLGRAAGPAVARALALLTENRLLVDGEHRPSDESTKTAAASFAAAVTRRTTQRDALASIERARVSVLGDGLAAVEIRRHLREMGLGRVSADALEPRADDSFAIAAPAADDHRLLGTLNAFALEHRLPWLQVLPFDGRIAVVGPVFVPGDSACRECFVLRRAACSGYDEDFDVVERNDVRAAAPTPLTVLAASLASLLALRWLTAADPALPGRLYAIEVGAVVRLRHDHVLRVPRCPRCGTPERSVPSPWFEGAA